MTTPAYFYARVSGRSQAKKNKSGTDAKAGLPRQREVCYEWAARNGFEIVQEFAEPGVCGDNFLEEREAAPKMLAEIERTGIKTVIVESHERMARGIDAGMDALKVFAVLGATVRCAVDGSVFTIDPTDPDAILVWGIKQVVAHSDKLRIVKRTAHGRKKYVADNNKPCGGNVPYGTLPGEAEIVAEIMRQEQVDKTHANIAAYLNGFAMPTRSGKPWTRLAVQSVAARQRKLSTIQVPP